MIMRIDELLQEVCRHIVIHDTCTVNAKAGILLDIFVHLHYYYFIIIISFVNNIYLCYIEALPFVCIVLGRYCICT